MPCDIVPKVFRSADFNIHGAVTKKFNLRLNACRVPVFLLVLVLAGFSSYRYLPVAPFICASFLLRA